MNIFTPDVSLVKFKITLNMHCMIVLNKKNLKKGNLGDLKICQKIIFI
jgi:hypothetical protein